MTSKRTYLKRSRFKSNSPFFLGQVLEILQMTIKADNSINMSLSPPRKKCNKICYFLINSELSVLAALAWLLDKKLTMREFWDTAPLLRIVIWLWVRKTNVCLSFNSMETCDAQSLISFVKYKFTVNWMDENDFVMFTYNTYKWSNNKENMEVWRVLEGNFIKSNIERAFYRVNHGNETLKNLISVITLWENLSWWCPLKDFLEREYTLIKCFSFVPFKCAVNGNLIFTLNQSIFTRNSIFKIF